MDLVQKSNDLINKLDWAGYAQLADSASLEKFHEILIPGIQTLAMATQADSVNLFGKYYKVEMLQNVTNDSFFVTIMNLVTELSPEIKSAFETIKVNNVGAVADGDSLVLVITRAEILVQGQSIFKLNIASCRNTDSGWKVELSPMIDEVAMSMRQGLPH